MSVAKRDLKKRRKMLAAAQRILRDDSISYVYVKKNGMYYRPNSCGYTSMQHEAGVFLKEKHARDMMDDDFNIISVDIEKHNEMINSKIKALEGRILKPKAIKE